LGNLKIGDILIATKDNEYEYTNGNELFKIIDIDFSNTILHTRDHGNSNKQRVEYIDYLSFDPFSHFFDTVEFVLTYSIKIICCNYNKNGWFVPSFWVDSYYFEKVDPNIEIL